MKTNKKYIYKKKTRKNLNNKITKKKINKKKYKYSKLVGGAGKCDKILKPQDFNSSDPFKALRPNDNYDINVTLQRIFPFEECKQIKIKDKDACLYNKYCNFNRDNGKCEYDNLSILNEFASNFAKNYSNKSINQLYSYFQTIIKDLFNLPRNHDPDNPQNVSENLLDWSEYLSLYQSSPSNECANYYKFRKIAVDALIVMIIISLCKLKNIETFQIFKLNTEIYSSTPGKSTNLAVKIIYQSVGSEAPTSDYDLTIYSIPYNSLTTQVTTIFNYAFKYGLGITAGELFDTNLYSHIFYIYSGSQLSKKNEFILLLGEENGFNKYFINAGNQKFYNNELLYANLVLLEYTKKYSISDFLKSSPFIQNTKLKGDYDSLYTPKDGNYANLVLPWIYNNTNPISNSSSLLTGLKHVSKCISGRMGSKECKANVEDVLGPGIREDFDSGTEEIIKILEDNINNANINILNVYISYMRLSLWLADETYHTFSGYFHVIHCVTIPGANIELINELMTSKKESLINMCRVSAIENFNFMCHYYKYSNFLKKSAKYLARVSHACALIEMLNGNSNFVLNNKNLKDFQNIGNHTYITDKYKNGKNDKNLDKSQNTGFFTTVLDNQLTKYKSSTSTDNRAILKYIYNCFVNSNGEDKGFGISSDFFIIN